MKRNFLNFAMAVVTLELAGALSTNAMNESGKKVAPIMGWKHVTGPNPCEAVQECSNSGNFSCTAPEGEQLFSRPISTCLTPLKRDVE